MAHVHTEREHSNEAADMLGHGNSMCSDSTARGWRRNQALSNEASGQAKPSSSLVSSIHTETRVVATQPEAPLVVQSTTRQARVRAEFRKFQRRYSVIAPFFVRETERGHSRVLAIHPTHPPTIQQEPTARYITTVLVAEVLFLVEPSVALVFGGRHIITHTTTKCAAKPSFE